LGLLSDFPPGRKLELLGLGSSFDTVLSTEQTGFLKPHGEPFRRFSEALGIPPQEILYVGNSPHLDAGGALAAGMGAALIQRGPFSTGMYRKKKKQDCFTFSAYRQLQEYVLG
jgi:putative hydrolase of the HAD superfamily